MPEMQASGKVAGAVYVSRGLLEFRADPDLPSHDPIFSKRSLSIARPAGAPLWPARCSRILGYERAYNLGGFKDWADSSGAVEK
jgi:hypothetical protein